MGTNFYWTPTDNTCQACGHNPAEELHIGKSSWGWVFSLHVIPYEDIEDLDDWKERFSIEGSSIRDEYGSSLTADKMIDRITNRGNNTHRHPIDSHCVGHGNGSWDLIPGEFS